MNLFKSTLTPLPYHDFDEVISLGMCCEPTFLIRRQGLSKQKKSYPFDWVSCTTVDHMIQLCENHFQGYTDLETRIHPIHGEQLCPKTYDIVIPHHTKDTFPGIVAKKIQIGI